MAKLLMTNQSTSQWNLVSQECLYGQCDQEFQYDQYDKNVENAKCDQECQETECNQEWQERLNVRYESERACEKSYLLKYLIQLY